MLTVTPIPAFEDNYLWVITQEDTNNNSSNNSRKAYIVDPGDGNAVHRHLQQHKLSLEGILITHRHPDHIGGIELLTSTYGDIPVYGPLSPRIPQITHLVGKGGEVRLFNQYTFQVFETSGHTEEHISYFHQSDNHLPLLFCGDTLFAAGCGRVFDGQPQKLYSSLMTFTQLPDNTLVYCAHEYTLANLKFAQAVDPNNASLNKRISEETKKRNEGISTIPTTIAKEKKTNPFLRISEPVIKKAVENYWKQQYINPVEVFCQLRLWKDKF